MSHIYSFTDAFTLGCIMNNDIKINLPRPCKSSDLSSLPVDRRQRFKSSAKPVFHLCNVSVVLNWASHSGTGTSWRPFLHEQHQAQHGLSSQTACTCQDLKCCLLTCLNYLGGFAASYSTIAKNGVWSRCVFPDKHSTVRLWESIYGCHLALLLQCNTCIQPDTW